MQHLQRVDIAPGALQAAGASPDALAKAVLGAMQEAHDSSFEGTKEDVAQLYEGNGVLLQAPLNQIGLGSTVEDLWVNVSRTDESVKLAGELFDKFDVDRDGHWNLNETSQVQMATEGTEMAEEAFNALIIAAAPDGGRRLTEDDLEKGLSKTQVIELYTDAARQRQLGFVLDVFKDHATVFQPSDSAPASTGEATGVD